MNPRLNSVMVYGNSGSTKTTQLYHLAKWILKKAGPGKRVRLIHSDGGGAEPFYDSGMIQRGEVEFFDYSNRQFALADIRRLSNGYWPIWVKDNQASRVYVPGGVEYFKTEDVCKTVDWENIVGYFIEGMTSTAAMLMAHCSNRDEKVGFKENYKYEEDGETFTGVTEGHYGLIQKEVYERHMRGFRALPIKWLVWTALVGKGQDRKNNNTPIRGPQMVGDAKTNEIPAWFNHVFHMDQVTYPDIPSRFHTLTGQTPTGGNVTKQVAWFRQHDVVDDLGGKVPYLCKSTIMPELLGKVYECFPYGFVPLDYSVGLDKYFQVLERMKKEVYGDGSDSN